MERGAIAAGLRSLGLSTGDVVLLHSALSSLGAVDGGAEAVLGAFLDVIGPQGTLVVPTFGALGIIPDTVKFRPDAVRSIHPCASVAAVGPAAKSICADHWNADTAHGADTPYTRLADRGGYVCLLGVDQDRCTLFHSVEALLQLPYLKDRQGAAETPAGPVEKTWKFFPGPHRDFIQWDGELQRRGIMKIQRIGNAVARLIKAGDLLAFGMATGKRRPDFALCNNPRCPDCIRQRGDLQKARFDGESFRLAASAALAGRYIPEMIETLGAAGLHRLELDAVQGLPIHCLSPADLKRHVGDLRAAGIDVIGLRSSTQGAPAMHLLEQAQALGVPRIVAPLQSGGEALLEQARAKKIRVSLYNTHIAAADAAALLVSLKAAGLDPAFTLRPDAFAACGEKPFLQAFRTKVPRFMDQLDVGDRTFDGTPAALAEGNAEIKELVSSLRCRSFGGYLVLAASNRPVGSLPETAARFLALLDAM